MKAVFTRGLALVEKLDWLPGLLTRLIVGWVFVQAGWGKFHNLENTIGFFKELGIPQPELQAPFVAGVELIGGLCFMLGFAARFAAVPLSITMVVALMTAHRQEIEDLSSLFGMSQFCTIVLFFWVAVRGAGCVSIDALLRRKYLSQ